MKKLLLILSLLLALTLLVACGGKKENKPTEPSTPVETPSGSETKPTPELPNPEIKFGFYNISNAAGKLLGSPEAQNKPITFDVAPQQISVEEANTWTIEPKVSAKGDLVYVLFCTYDPHDVAAPDKLLPGKGLVRARYNDNDANQQWTLVKNEDGTFKMINYKNPRFCLITDASGQPVLAETSKVSTEANWKIEEQTVFEEFRTWYSKDERDRKIIFQLPVNITEAANITSDRIQQFVEDTVTIYNTYIEFTDFVTYDHIILKAYETEEYIAYVVSGYMCVSADKDFITADLRRMGERTVKHKVQDCNFMMLHEMGHMFDRGQKWSFEGEAMTDIKAAYVLYANKNFVAAPSEFDSATYFDATNITDSYKRLGGSSMDGTKDGYNIYCCAAIFVDIIQNNIKDWDKVKEMYHWYSNNIDTINPVKWYKEAHNLDDKATVTEGAARLDMYIAKLTEYGGVDVRSLINPKDYQSMLAKCS